MGTWAMSSPEMISDKRAGKFTDIWSLGIIIYQLCTLHSPSPHDSTFTYSEYIRMHPIPSTYSKKLRALTDWML